MNDFYLITEKTATEDADELIIICENYIIGSQTHKKSQGPWSLMGRGNMESIGVRYEIPFVLQSPSFMHDWFQPDKRKIAKEIGLWHVGGEGHANDSIGHGIKYHFDRNPRWQKTFLVV